MSEKVTVWENGKMVTVWENERTVWENGRTVWENGTVVTNGPSGSRSILVYSVGLPVVVIYPIVISICNRMVYCGIWD